jgi:hypothetical protein
MQAHTFLRFPVLSFSAFTDGASSSPRPPGPMLLLRVLRAVFLGDNAAFFGDWEGALNEPFAIRPSAMLSLLAMVGPLFGGLWWWCSGREPSCKHGRRQSKQCAMRVAKASPSPVTIPPHLRPSHK